MPVDYGDVYIIDALRTPIGKFGGALATVRPDDMAAHVIKAVVERSGVPADEIEDVYFGSSNQAGEDNRDVARMGLLLAGLPVTVPGATVNRLCASGLEAVADASRCVAAGEGDLYLAGGVESMTRAPFVFGKTETAFSRTPPTVYDSTIGWRFVNPNFPHSTEGMGETAENVAERYSISREDQDEFAAGSHRRAAAAWDEGRFEQEVVAIDAPQRRGDPIRVEQDEGIRRDSTAEGLGKLRAAFREGGTVTAGNSSQVSDGAACLVLGSRERTERSGKEPLARVVATAAAGVDPAVMGVGPIDAVRKLLDRTGLTIDDIDLVELNEAFASQSLACARELGIDREQLNVNGGAIALGHPLGCSGARLAGTLAYELRRRGLKRGIATLCVGVGQGLAVLIENPAVA
ncbi:MAG TPA: thiolase family protein [Solirubrobacterales bacterium]|jgi:3-oxo-5,6-didehydrosuberyl-CoA/3-oxoadipyl-CoA thiolase|nr:thiolase family protein [Solirubrobacterales bacterium]